MKKLSMIAIGMILFGGVTLSGNGSIVDAAETITSQASINILSGPLSMTKAGDIDFGEIKITGEEHQIKNGEDISVQFSDYRGTGEEGFELQVKSDNAFENKGLNLTLIPKEINVTQGTSLPPFFEVTDEFHVVAKGEQGVIEGGATDYDLTLGTSLLVNKQVRAGNYQTTLTWDLSATPNE
ncbi:exported hypothetical protein [Carnobacterium maltaromaticum]|uniref:WxL domain-containing protein n=1 Tax=Carnobacterium maltaromaticum TaxID=2751 RepID=UPI00191B9023|nr:WxL domain-containing protein [Carnobacterium maltaromaticum]CAD5896747.1 exported hypothetical protein [Carnobacterium maltaromaticum]